MTLHTAAPPAAPAPPDPAPQRRRNGHRLRGWGYASPTALFVLVLFVVPLALVFRMSASRWPLLSGDQGINFPDNFSAAVDNRFFADSVAFTPTLVRKTPGPRTFILGHITNPQLVLELLADCETES